MANPEQITINKSTIYAFIFTLVGVIALVAAASMFIFSKNSKPVIEEKTIAITDSESREKSDSSLKDDTRQHKSEEQEIVAISQKLPESGIKIPKKSNEDKYVSVETVGHVNETNNVNPKTGETIYSNKGKQVDLNNYSGSVKDTKGNKIYYVNGEKVSKHDWNLITNGWQDEAPPGTKLIQYDEMPADIQAELDELNESAAYS